MFKKIGRNDAIFKSELFLRDVIAFNVMISILDDINKYPSPKIFSNGSNCVVVNSDSEHPVLVWTADQFTDFESLTQLIQQEFYKNNPLKIISKFIFFEFIKTENKFSVVDIETLGVYECCKLNNIEYVGFPDNIKTEEVLLVAELLALFGTETGTDKNATTEKYIDLAQEFVTSSLNKAWRNKQGKIVALTKLKVSEDYVRAGHVITTPEERGKSYAKMLVHYMTNHAMHLGKKPVLYTDYNYSASNKCYMAVGYEYLCTIANYELENI
ncbi:MAG: GNAT family N-acetyltransferase [Alphaproteobacteria bacterium]|nr:GNAT family N-acetyltransferase [Alphaproteobacteria bacterium]